MQVPVIRNWISAMRVELAQRDVARHLEFALVVVVIGHFEPLEVEMQRLAGEQALVAGVPVVELDELGVVELGTHQLALHGLLGAARGVAGEAVILVVEAGQLAPHPVVERRVGELVLQEGLHLLRLLDLRLDVLVVVDTPICSAISEPMICRPIDISSRAARLTWSIHSSARRW